MAFFTLYNLQGIAITTDNWNLRVLLAHGKSSRFWDRSWEVA
jgi:hypothetical protein